MSNFFVPRGRFFNLSAFSKKSRLSDCDKLFQGKKFKQNTEIVTGGGSRYLFVQKPFPPSLEIISIRNLFWKEI